MSALPGVRCPWCAKEQAANANLALVGVAVQHDDESWRVRAISERGVSDREWMVDEVVDFVPSTTFVVEGESAVVIIEPDFIDDWALIADEAGNALVDARDRLDLAMRAAEIVGRCAAEDGISEVEVALRGGGARRHARAVRGHQQGASGGHERGVHCPAGGRRPHDGAPRPGQVVSAPAGWSRVA